MSRKIQLVRWVDSAVRDQGGWTTLTDIDHSEVVCETVGFVIRETGDSLLLAANLGDEEIGLVFQIPQVSVKERIDLEAKR